MWKACSYRIKIAQSIFFVLPINTKDGSEELDEVKVKRNNENKDWILANFKNSYLVDSDVVKNENAKVWWMCRFQDPAHGINQETLMIIQENLDDTKYIEGLVEQVNEKIPITKIQRGKVIL